MMHVPFVKYKCPICNDIEVEVPGELIHRAPFFPIPFTYIHGEPKHALVLYLDANFRVRGHEISTLVQADDSLVVTEDTLLVKDVIREMDPKSLAAFTECILTRVPLVVLGAPRTRKSAIIMLRRLIWWRGIIYREIGDREPTTDPIWNTFSMKIENYEPKSKYLLALAERIKNAPSQIAEVVYTKEIETLLAIARMISNEEKIDLENEKELLPYLQWDKNLVKEIPLIIDMVKAINEEKEYMKSMAR